jgi:hypothetical protein
VLPTSGLSPSRTNEVPESSIIAVGARVHISAIEAEQMGSNPQMPEWLDISGNGRSTMKTTKTLMLAAFAALSLGVGSAMADGSDVSNDYQAAKILAARQAQLGQVQSGASDMDTPRNGFQLGPFHATPSRPNALVGGQGGG